MNAVMMQIPWKSVRAWVGERLRIKAAVGNNRRSVSWIGSFQRGQAMASGQVRAMTGTRRR